MSTYLQRLYDTANGTATSGAANSAAPRIDASPAQRSSSPLLAVDQRLATPTYAASFLLGLPGAADPEQSPSPGQDQFRFPEVARQDDGLAPDAAIVIVPARNATAADTPPEDVEERDAPRARGKPDGEERDAPHASREPSVRPPPHATPADKADAALLSMTPAAQLPGAQSLVGQAGTLREATQSAVPIARHLHRGDSAAQLLRRPESALPEPSADHPLVAIRPVAGATPPFAPVNLRAQPANAPPMVHPALTPRAVESVPPLLAPRVGETVGLGEQVRRLVHEAMSSEAMWTEAMSKGAKSSEGSSSEERRRRVASQGQIRDRNADSAADASAPGSRARTAEAFSVIGPLDRPARASTLFGLRLR